MIFSALVFSLWSYFLLVQGETNYFDIKPLLISQLKTYLEFVKINYLWLVGLLGLFLLTLKLRMLKTADMFLYFVICILATVTFIFLIYTPGIEIPIPALILGGTGILTMIFLINSERTIEKNKFNPANTWDSILIFIVVSTYILSNFVFYKFVFSSDMLKPNLNKNARTSVHPINIEEVVESYHEYQNVRGYEKKKDSLKKYLLKIDPGLIEQRL